ncbi:hypothetical protein [Nonomuraea jabiensis]|uniref:Uncharacterized protein n=1 Tax=Nonomuraea jabiensis TaxID=882448 RepID=A0A7W9GGE4_9ACTN|nr:hypothetical protein [Nonomuraea jabiensis]MBB5783362.1 hypothetical protein [Nonomuraea jabiensis]
MAVDHARDGLMRHAREPGHVGHDRQIALGMGGHWRSFPVTSRLLEVCGRLEQPLRTPKGTAHRYVGGGFAPLNGTGIKSRSGGEVSAIWPK